MPCYNAAGTLEEALISLEEQTYSDYELVAVDDGSSDSTGEILQQRARQDSRIRVISQSHAGLVEALQRGLDSCRAPLVARMDGDDCSHPTRLEKQAAYMMDHPDVDVLSCLVCPFPSQDVREGFRVYIAWLNGLQTNEAIRREIFVESPLPHPSVLFRRDAVRKVGGYQEKGWPEDYDLWLRMYVRGSRFSKLPEVLLDWREHEERLTRTDPRYSVENFLRAKAHYLMLGPLADRDAVLIWGAGMMGRRLSKHLLRNGAPLDAFIDVDPRKIGNTRRGLPILAPKDLPGWWSGHKNGAVLAAVGARGARQLIRERLEQFGLREGEDWWGVA